MGGGAVARRTTTDDHEPHCHEKRLREPDYPAGRGKLASISAQRASTPACSLEWVMTQNRPVRIASSVIAATAAGVSPVGPVNEPRIASRNDSAASVRCSMPSAAGRPRSDSMTRVSTELGHSTLTPMGDPSSCSSMASVSETDTTATLVAAYGPMKITPLNSPALEAGLAV